MSKDTITETIKKHVTKYDKSPYQINDGLCIEFAEKVAKEHKEAQSICWKNMVPWLKYTTPAGKYFTGHQWILFDNKHYDAETPEGVDKFYNIPFIQRKIEQSNYQSAIEILRETHKQKS